MTKKFKKIEVLKAVEGSGGVVSEVARNLGCNWHTAKKYIDKYPDAKELLLQEEKVLIDEAKMVIKDAIVLEKDTQIAKWLLMTKGGYSETKKVEHSGGVDHEFTGFDFLDNLASVPKQNENEKED